MPNIWIDKEREGCGYGAVKIYECPDFYVSAGGLNAHRDRERFGGNPNVILFCFKNFDITLIGGQKELDAWYGLRDWERGLTSEMEMVLHRHVFQLLLSNLDYRWFSYLLNDAYTRGTKVGKNDLRRQLNNLLREEF